MNAQPDTTQEQTSAKPAKLKKFDAAKAAQEQAPPAPVAADALEDPFREKPEASAVQARAKEVADAIETILERGAPGPRIRIKQNLRSYSFEEDDFIMHYKFVGTGKVETDEWRERNKTVVRDGCANIHPSIPLGTILDGLARHLSGSY